uniref:Uncharacterized protein n=1 Tax=Pelagomonas calceolata TaxID=35677 RepID=A0A7S3ZL34_9STRA|mmetsp:Transcript_6773/g.19090  ORF Transcript_6773/g.19090 Transcript_6773/m.19090 type:complete len:159 (-) Transcript_6773:12-488(-)
MRSVGLLLCAASVQSFAPPALRSFVRPGEHGCRTTAIRAKENGGGGASELTREGKLIVSILIDLIGMSTYLLPVAGEGADVGWAPVSAALIFWLYGSGIFAAAGFAEEILPGLDFVPTATIAWFLTQSDAGQRIGEKVTPEAAPKRKAEDLRDGAIDV